MQNLTDDLLLCILRLLPAPADLAHAAAVNQRFRACAESDAAWAPQLARMEADLTPKSGFSCGPDIPPYSGPQLPDLCAIMTEQDPIWPTWRCRQHMHQFSRFNPDTTLLEYQFLQPVGLVWVPMHPPLRCGACDVTFDTQDAFVSHCSEPLHREMLLPPSQRLPEQFRDPRLFDATAHAALPCKQRCRALREYDARIRAVLHAPLTWWGDREDGEAEAGRVNVARLHDWATLSINALHANGQINERQLARALASCTRAMVAEQLVFWAEREYEDDGLYASDARDVVVLGWGGEMLCLLDGDGSWCGFVKTVAGIDGIEL